MDKEVRRESGLGDRGQERESTEPRRIPETLPAPARRPSPLGGAPHRLRCVGGQPAARSYTAGVRLSAQWARPPSVGQGTGLLARWCQLAVSRQSVFQSSLSGSRAVITRSAQPPADPRAGQLFVWKVHQGTEWPVIRVSASLSVSQLLVNHKVNE